MDNKKYIDLETLINNDINNDKYIYYQIQLNNETIIIKKIGHGQKMGDILLKEKFGSDKNNYSIYSCIYEKKDFNNIENKYLPIIKITDNIRIYSIGIILNEAFKDDTVLNKFDIYMVHGNTVFKKIKLDKNINNKNIIEKLVSKLIDLDILIL